MKRSPVVVALAMAFALLLAACGSDTDHGSAPSTTAARPGAAPAAFPVTLDTGTAKVTLDRKPTKIVSLAPSLTETLYAVGAGDQVVAVDDQSNYPADAPKTKLSGYEPNIEAIGNYSPDLVIASDDPGDLVKGMKTLGIPTLILPAVTTLDQAYDQIDLVGRATGHADEAETLVASMKKKIADLQATVPKGAPVTYFHELDNTLYTVTSKTFIGQLYKMAGFENVADAADKSGDGYPQISAEFLLQADPDAIFLADTKCCAQNRATVAARPGWKDLTAVKEGHVYELDDDISSRWGPRVVDLFAQLVKVRTELAAGGN